MRRRTIAGAFVLSAALVATFGTAASAAEPTVPGISEIHYDNVGTDLDEAVEIEAPVGFDLTGWQIVLYNGNGGAVYNTRTLAGAVPAAGVVVATLPGRRDPERLPGRHRAGPAGRDGRGVPLLRGRHDRQRRPGERRRGHRHRRRRDDVHPRGPVAPEDRRHLAGSRGELLRHPQQRRGSGSRSGPGRLRRRGHPHDRRGAGHRRRVPAGRQPGHRRGRRHRRPPHRWLQRRLRADGRQRQPSGRSRRGLGRRLRLPDRRPRQPPHPRDRRPGAGQRRGQRVLRPHRDLHRRAHRRAGLRERRRRPGAGRARACPPTRRSASRSSRCGSRP